MNINMITDELVIKIYNNLVNVNQEAFKCGFPTYTTFVNFLNALILSDEIEHQHLFTKLLDHFIEEMLV